LETINALSRINSISSAVLIFIIGCKGKTLLYNLCYWALKVGNRVQ